MLVALALVFALLPATMPALAVSEADDLAAARALFERNLEAIQRRDREAYLACYLHAESLVRTGPLGMLFGWDDLSAGTPASGSDEWPHSLDARDLQLAWVRDGVVYGTYRYRAIFAAGDPAQDGLSERLFVATDDGWRIAVSTAFPAPDGTPAPPVALVGATLWDGTGAPALRDAVIVVRDGRIAAVGPRDAVEVPAGVDVVDLGGRFVVPGLIDTHVHYSQTGWVDGRPDAADVRAEFPYERVMAENEAHPERFHRAFLACGVTAVFDVGGFPWTRRMGARTELSPDAPHVAAAGALLTTWVPEEVMLPDRAQFVLMESEEGVRATVRSHAAAGSDAIKVWFIVRAPGDVEAARPLVLAAGDEAHRQGLPLIVHATGLAEAKVAVEAGAHLLVHSVVDVPVDEEFLEACRAAGTFYCPTLTVIAGYGWLAKGVVPESVRDGLGWVDAGVRERVLRTPGLPGRVPEEAWAGSVDARQAQSLEQMDENLRAVVAAGIPVVFGTDAGNPLTLHGPSAFVELEAMAAAGMSQEAVLLAATRDAAKAMRRGDDLGRIVPGAVADLVVLARDPLVDVANLRSLTHVMRAGRLQARELLRPAE
ncbi:MAG: amidohydrolase family protein [Planctomycetes bacterium]|nr:amidohydrolase family protein [Planctomycetota bacterium]